MQFTKLLIITLLLSGCAREPSATETIADTAKDTVTAMYETLPENCKTEVTKKQAETAQKAIDAVVQSCEDQKTIITQDKVKWKVAFFGLLIAICAWLGRKFFI